MSEDINKPEDHSYIYSELSQENKDKVDAILSFLGKEKVSVIRHLLSAVNRELDFRSFLSHQ